MCACMHTFLFIYIYIYIFHTCIYIYIELYRKLSISNIWIVILCLLPGVLRRYNIHKLFSWSGTKCGTPHICVVWFWYPILWCASCQMFEWGLSKIGNPKFESHGVYPIHTHTPQNVHILLAGIPFNSHCTPHSWSCLMAKSAKTI